MLPFPSSPGAIFGSSVTSDSLPSATVIVQAPTYQGPTYQGQTLTLRATSKRWCMPHHDDCRPGDCFDGLRYDLDRIQAPSLALLNQLAQTAGPRRQITEQLSADYVEAKGAQRRSRRDPRNADGLWIRGSTMRWRVHLRTAHRGCSINREQC